jgi:hypothetical protein
MVRGFQQPLRQCEALVLYPLPDRRAGGFAKAPRESAPTHQRAPGEAVELVRHIEVLAQPLEQRREAIALGGGGHRLLDVLRLPALPVWRDHHATCRAVGRLGAIAHAQQVQAAVDARGRARRSEHVAVVDIQHLGLQLHLRV